jgi:hypothetical protein
MPGHNAVSWHSFYGTGGEIKNLRPVTVPASKHKSQAREFWPTCSVTLINNTVLSVKISIDVLLAINQ